MASLIPLMGANKVLLNFIAHWAGIMASSNKGVMAFGSERKAIIKRRLKLV